MQIAGLNVSQSNTKVGHALIISRPVGDSCPSSCPLLDSGKCYAKRTESRFRVTRRSAMANMDVSADQLYGVLCVAEAMGLPVRIHERGDFGRDDAVDHDYVEAWRSAATRFRENHPKSKVRIWTYTHFTQSPEIASLPFDVYASCETQAYAQEARRAGFKLIAWVVDDRAVTRANAPTTVDQTALGGDDRTLVCPEYQRGVTCEACRWCVDGRGDVAFLTRPGRRTKR